jgi:hypothetical protein
MDLPLPNVSGFGETCEPIACGIVVQEIERRNLNV